MKAVGPRLRQFGAAIALLLLAAAAVAQTWPRLRDDGVHDPRSPAVRNELQEPGKALGAIAEKAPDEGIGNQVRWVKALQSNLIQPRPALHGRKEVRELDLDVFLDIGGSMGVVRFPHLPHTQWLDCANCHPALFKDRVGSTPIAMLAILDGEQCGQCHGAVAFPLTECLRCHPIPQKDFPPLEAKLGLQRVGPRERAAVRTDTAAARAMLEKSGHASPATPTTPTAGVTAPASARPAPKGGKP